MVFKLPIRSQLSTLCLFFVISLSIDTLLGCQTANKPVENKDSVEPGDDLTALIKEQAKATLYEPKYLIVDDSRLSICEFKAFPGDINILANAFDMTELKDPKTLAFIKYDEKNSKLGASFIAGKSIRAYGVFGHPVKLKCKSGRSFEYMLLFYKPRTNEASIEACYTK